MVARLDKNELYAAGASPYPFFRALLEASAATAPVKLLLGHDTNEHGPQENWTGQSDQGSFHAAGIPEDVFQNVVLDHATTEALISKRSFGFVNFTGSVGGGQAIEVCVLRP